MIVIHNMTKKSLLKQQIELLPIVKNGPAKEIYFEKAADVIPAPSTITPLIITLPPTPPYSNILLSPLNIIITSAVIVQITTVSINGSKMQLNPQKQHILSSLQSEQ